MMQVAILGNGQLGAMLRLAGARIGIEVTPIDPNSQQSLTLGADVPIVIEIEHWPNNALTARLQQQPGWLNASAYPQLVDRGAQKTLVDRLGLPTAPWRMTDSASRADQLHAQLGPDVFLKRRTGGYDGRGQQRLRAAQPAAMPDWIDVAIAEQAIPFSAEVSLVAARNRAGTIVCYPLTENLHQDGILYASVSPSPRWHGLQAQAESIMHSLLNHLDYVGVLAIEFFVADNSLLINEIAPRVHNSGHWTQAGAVVSQFEMQLRAVCNLPMPQPAVQAHSVMINLIGLGYQSEWLAVPGAQFHWYGKELRPGRKMGHINLADSSPDRIVEWVNQLVLPEKYLAVKHWVAERLGEAKR